jgi:hypothetical protein
MARVLCVLDSRWSWKAWLERNRKNRPVLTFDPGVLPARATLSQSERLAGWRFVGTTSAPRNPIGVMGAGLALAHQAGEDWIGFLFDPGQNLVLNQLALEMAQALRVTHVLVPRGSQLETHGWPVGAETVELEEGYPAMVRDAQRRAQWLEVFQAAEDHTVELAAVHVLSGRLGAGIPVPMPDPGALAWKYGPNLHVVSARSLTPSETDRLTAQHKVKQVSHATPDDYIDLVCSLADQEGQDLGIGTVQHLDLETATLVIKNTAAAPAHPQILKLGTTKVDAKGRETGEIKPWSL